MVAVLNQRGSWARRSSAGFSIIEILIALFVFMVGALGVFSIIPVAMDQSGRAVRNTRGAIVAQLALDSLTSELELTPLFYCNQASVDASPNVTATPSEPWGLKAWKGHCLSIRNGLCSRQAQLVASNTEDTLEVAEAWSGTVAARDRFRVGYYAKGTVSSAELRGTTNISVASARWRTDQWVGLRAMVTKNLGVGQSGLITGNTADTLKLSVETAWNPLPDSTSGFRIYGYWEGKVDTAAANTLTPVAAPAPGWTPDQWKDLYVVITAGTGRGQARCILTNTTTGLTVKVNWDKNLDTTSEFRIVPLAIDSYSDPLVPPPGRYGTLSADPTANSLRTDRTDISFTSCAGLYILITSGRAAGRVVDLVSVAHDGVTPDVLVADLSVDFGKQGVREADSFYIIGNTTGVFSYPNNAFGTAGGKQTAPDPSARANAEYRYAVVFSDSQGMPALGPVRPVRVDALVFRDYDDSKTPAQNKRAVAWRTAYVSPLASR